MQQNWDRVKELFEAAVELESADRDAFLNQQCGDDLELRSVVEAMLEADAAPPSVLNVDHQALSTMLPDDLDSELPSQVGPYRVESLIGRGGMGLVVKAEHVDLPRKVALKLIRDRWVAPMELERFRREQAVLARLQHPHIARLLDAGRTEDGIPYFAMSYIDGHTITEYSENQKLSIRDRLSLFLDVCDAVQFAHRNLVIHRDLKPSNILVDQTGSVKLLDFGISKLLEEEDQGVLTRTDQRVLTPSYASPEQIRGESVTTSTDVYSLGVVLYELLVGQRPYSLSGKSASEVARIVGEEDPARPSVAGSHKALRGDLDNIVLKALEKTPQSRYPSVEALALDIQRYLDGREVHAHAASVGYRVKKFVNRHRWGVGTAAGFLVLLIVGAGAMTYQQAETARERDRATLEAEKSDRVVQFMMGLFEANDPAEALGDSVTAGALLQRGVEQAEALSDQPLIQAETFHVIGGVYSSLGRYEDAIELIQRAIALRREYLGPQDPDVAESLRALSVAFSSLDRVGEAEATARDALAIDRQTSELPTEPIARSLNQLGVSLNRAGKYEEADSLLSLSYDILRELRGEDDAEVVGTLASRSALLLEQGRWADAEATGRKVLDWRRSHLPENHPLLADAANNLAVSLKSQSRFDEAQPFYEESLSIRRRVYGDSHPSTVAGIRDLAIFYGIQGEYETAEPYFLEAVDGYRVAFGDASPRTAGMMTAYAVLLGRVGRQSEAEMVYRQALPILENALGADHLTTGNARYNLGTTLGKQGKLDEGLPIIRRAVDSYLLTAGEGHPRYAEYLCGLAVYLSHARLFTEAEANARMAVALDTTHDRLESRGAAIRLGQLGRVLLAKGDFEAAETTLSRALPLHVTLTAEDHPESLTIADALGQAWMHLGEFEKSDSLLTATYNQQRERLGVEHSETMQTRQHILDLYEAWGRSAPELANP